MILLNTSRVWEQSLSSHSHLLPKTVCQREEPYYDPKVKQFVNHDFYVDDGLKSLPSAEAAASLLKRTQNALSKSNLRLQKIASTVKKLWRILHLKTMQVT